MCEFFELTSDVYAFIQRNSFSFSNNTHHNLKDIFFQIENFKRTYAYLADIRYAHGKEIKFNIDDVLCLKGENWCNV